tara:strand:+ start:932 stop:1834 length:903 start_codon:yes stop_codon:yes gene_type:complete
MENIKVETTGKKHTKTLDTLVEDINNVLTGISSGIKPDVKEEQIDKFLENTKLALLDWLEPRKSSGKGLRMSIIGRPARQLWYDNRVDKKQEIHDPSTQLKFLYGHMLEHLLLFLVEVSGHVVTDQQKKTVVEDVTGHMDCKIDGEVVDVKSASPMSFKKFKTGSLYDNDPFGYVAQLAGYEHNEPSSNGGLFAVDKSSGEIALFRPDELMKPNAEELIKTLKEKIQSEEPPEKCYQPIPHDKTGNYKLPVGCVYCSHKFTCHKDTNEGRGLRVFKYANSNVYMTTVENTPRVEEITNNE